jgi:hypothetical protein
MSEANESYQDRDAMLTCAPARLVLGGVAPRFVANGPPPAPAEERLALFWWVIGGTLLLTAALVVAMLYQQLTRSVGDLRHDVVRLKEARGDLIEKDEVNSRMVAVWNGLNDAKAAGPDVAAVREQQALQEQQFRQVEDQRKELIREVLLLRERVAALEGRSSALRSAAARDIPD